MHTCFRKAAEIAALWEDGRDIQDVWPELTQEQLEKCAQVCLGFAHAGAISALRVSEKQAGAWRGLHTFLLRKPELNSAEEPAALRDCGLGSADEQLWVLQIGARVFCLQSNARVHFDAGRVEHATACAKEALCTARSAGFAASYFEPDVVSFLHKEHDNYEYVRSKMGTQAALFNMSMCADTVALPTLFVPLTEVYECVRKMT
jgi:hypothetical protein